MTHRPYPPGPEGWFPGHLAFSFRADVLGFLTHAARTYGDFVPFRAGKLTFVLLNDPELIRQVLVTRADAFIKGPALRRAKDTLGEGLLTSEGEVHRRQRRLSQPAFHPRQVAGYVDVMTGAALRTAGEWRDGQTIDIHEQMMRLTLRVVAETLFGADVEADVERIGHAMDVSVRMFTRAMSPFGPLLNRLPLPSNFRFHKARRLLNGTVDRFIRQRRMETDGAAGRTDLLSLLLRATDDAGVAPTADAGVIPTGPGSRQGAMTDVQLRDEALTLFTAGHETTANALTFAWYLLAQNPAAEAKLHAELDAVLGDGVASTADLDRLPYARAVVSETMRLYPPAWAVAREATEAVEIGGYELPAGTVVLASQWVTHRDPRWWPDPERFDPSRWLDPAASEERPRYAYFPFGGGPRSCIGEAFAWYEGVLVLATLAQKWQMRLATNGPLNLIATITLRPRNGVPVFAQRRR